MTDMVTSSRKAAGKKLSRAFEALAESPRKMPDMTPEEIDAEIAQARRERRAAGQGKARRAVRRNPTRRH